MITNESHKSKLTFRQFNGRIAEARQRYQEYLDRFPWGGEHAQEAQAALERLGEV